MHRFQWLQRLQRPTPGWWQTAILGYLGGMLYVLLEWLWRGRSHPSMFLLGGLCFVLLGGFNEGQRPELPLWLQALMGAAVITALELACGLVVNQVLGWAVWDYSHLPLNVLGQICLPFSLLWVPLSAAAVLLEDWLRRLLFGKAKVQRRWR